MAYPCEFGTRGSGASTFQIGGGFGVAEVLALRGGNFQSDFTNGFHADSSVTSVAVGDQPFFGQVEFGFLCGLQMLVREFNEHIGFDV